MVRGANPLVRMTGAALAAPVISGVFAHRPHRDPCRLEGQTQVTPRTRTRPNRPHQEPEAVTWTREKAGLAKRALASLVGISEQLMGEIESGWRSATPRAPSFSWLAGQSRYEPDAAAWS